MPITFTPISSSFTTSQGTWYIPTTTSNTTQIWTDWNYQNTASTASVVWEQWNIQSSAWIIQTHQMTQPALTPAQIEALTVERQAMDNRRSQLEQERREARAVANVKASRLLELVLSDEQRSELKTHRRFHVRGSRGRRYCIHANGQSGNVSWVDDAGKELGRFCAHPAGYLPDADAWIAQALALETDEDAFLAVANLHQGTRPPVGLIAA